MKHKKHRPSDDDSADSVDSDEASDKSSSSDSDSDSEEYDRRHKKRKRYASSSQSESDSSEHEHQKRSKKRKHKKKKKKHSKKKRRVESVEESDSNGPYELKRKSKHKRKHSSSKKTNSSTGSEYESDQNGHHVHSTVKESRHSTEDHRQPHATYYQKPYHGHDNDEGKREEEVQRFYRGSSKDRYSQTRREHYHDKREYTTSRQRYETPHEADYRKTYHSARGGYDHKEYSRGDGHGHPRQVDVPKRHIYDEGRKYQDRRGYPPERHHGREYQDNRDRYRDYQYPDRAREPRRDKNETPAPPPAANLRETSRAHSPRRPDRYHRGDDRRRPDERRYEHKSERPIDRQPEVRTEDRRREYRPEDDKRPPPKQKKSRFTNDDENKEFEWGKSEVKKEDSPSAAEKEKPNFGLSGKLTADANTVNGVVIKYTEPDDAKQPKRRWRFYPFKGDKSLPILFIHRQSCFILGRDKKVVDIHLEHPSVSKQHAALQYRATPFQRADGTEGRRVRPYIIDLESANGTFVNNKKIEARRYVELLERDVVKFGFSQREYVLLHENSKDDAQDDDNQDQPPDIGAAVTTTQQIKLEKQYKQAETADGD